MPTPTFIFPSAPALSASAIYALDVFADKPVFQPESASFTRATTATRTNSSGLIETVSAGIARVDWSGSGAPNTLLEPQRTNLALRSEEFDNASWFKSNTSVVANSIASPSGLINADTLIADGTFINHRIEQQISVISGSKYTLSVFAKKDTNNFIQLFGSGVIWGVNAFANFNIETGIIGTIGSSATAKIENIGNGWYRCSATFEAISTSTGTIIFSIISSNTSIRGESNSLSTSVFLWGAQFEAGAYATSYIPTTSTSVTRNADAFTLSNVYTSGKITSAGGTWFVDLRNNIPLIRDAFSNGIQLSGSTDLFQIRNTSGASGGRLTVLKVIGGTGITLYATTTDTAKIAIKWNGATADIFVNGVKQVSATVFTETTIQTLDCLAADVPKYINSMALYPTPLLDYQCEMLTGLKFDTYNEMAGYYNYTIQ